MKSKKTEQSPQKNLSREELNNLINLDHVANSIDRDYLCHELGRFYTGKTGQPLKTIGLMAGLHYLKHVFALLDGQVIERWVKGSYWQYFFGMQYFQHHPPVDPTHMTRFRQHIEDSGCKKMHATTIQASFCPGIIDLHKF